VENRDILKTLGVTKSYDFGRVKALRGVDLKIPIKAFVSLAGPSGSGKTTLLNILGGLDSPDSGEVLLNQVNLAGMNEKERTLIRREKIGFIFQQFNLVPVLTALENVELPLEILRHFTSVTRRQAAMCLLKLVGLEGLERRYPNQMSGGQQQRVAVARALVKKPNIVLADEPTANLDSETGAHIVELMREMRNELGIAFVLSTHDPRVMERTEATFFMKDGKISNDASSSGMA